MRGKVVWAERRGKGGEGSAGGRKCESAKVRECGSASPQPRAALTLAGWRLPSPPSSLSLPRQQGRDGRLASLVTVRRSAKASPRAECSPSPAERAEGATWRARCRPFNWDAIEQPLPVRERW